MTHSKQSELLEVKMAYQTETLSCSTRKERRGVSFRLLVRVAGLLHSSPRSHHPADRLHSWRVFACLTGGSHPKSTATGIPCGAGKAAKQHTELTKKSHDAVCEGGSTAVCELLLVEFSEGGALCCAVLSATA